MNFSLDSKFKIYFICLHHRKDDDDNLKNGGQTKALVLLKHIHNQYILKADVLKHRIPTDR